MNTAEIDALLDGLAPVVKEYVAAAVGALQQKLSAVEERELALRARVAWLEARDKNSKQ